MCSLGTSSCTCASEAHGATSGGQCEQVHLLLPQQPPTPPHSHPGRKAFSALVINAQGKQRGLGSLTRVHCCVTVGQLLTLSEPQQSHLCGDNGATFTLQAFIGLTDGRAAVLSPYSSSL